MTLRTKIATWWTNVRLEVHEQKTMERRHREELAELFASQKERRRRLFDPA